MALATRISNEAAKAACNAITALVNSGKVRIYSGTQPADPDAALSGNTLLAELTLNSTAFQAAVDATGKATATANAITGDSSADASGTESFFRVFKVDGTTAVWDGTAGASGCDMNLGVSSITLGATVNITGWTFTVPET